MYKCEKMSWRHDEIEIIKISPPLGILFYCDFHYETLLEIRRKKIEKILNIINNGKKS